MFPKCSTNKKVMRKFQGDNSYMKTTLIATIWYLAENKLKHHSYNYIWVLITANVLLTNNLTILIYFILLHDLRVE